MIAAAVKTINKFYRNVFDLLDCVLNHLPTFLLHVFFGRSVFCIAVSNFSQDVE